MAAAGAEAGVKAEPRTLIRAFRSSHGLFGERVGRGGVSAFEDVQYTVFLEGHQGCALSRWCGNVRLDKNGDAASKRLYSIVFSKNAPLIEPDAVSMNLNLHLKQMLCKGCVDKTTKKKFSAELNIRYDDAAAEILRHLWNVSSSPTSLLSDYERCLAGVSTAQLPGWAQTLESAPGNYVEPQQYDWQGAAAGAATPEALRDLVSLANARQKARDAARASQRAAVAAASAALEALDKAATAEATLLVPLREELRKQEKGEKRKRLLMQMEEAARQKEESEARAAELEATARAKRAAAAALAEEVGAAA